MSDHLPILCVETTLPKNAYNNCEVYFKCITLDKLNAFRQCISNADWSAVHLKNGADDAYDAFRKRSQTIYNSYFPLKLFKMSKNAHNPWETKYILYKIIQNDLYKSFLKTRESEKLRIIEAYDNKLTKELRRARTYYYNTLFKSSERRSYMMWESLNLSLHRNRSSGTVDELTRNKEN